jgi:hypothetical protein
MRRIFTSNPHKLGGVLAAPLVLLAVVVALAGGDLLSALAFLVLGALIYGGIVLLAYIDRALVEKRDGRR